jgi:FkbM family methyltransferase
MNLDAYRREAAFIASSSADIGSAIRLSLATARFHLGNFFKSSTTLKTEPFAVNVKIGGLVRPVSLRQDSGDLFIFHEVFAMDAYRIEDDVIDPQTVSTIIDCGANIGITALYFAGRYPNARIFSIEPDPSNFAVLKRNAASEPRITPINAAVVGRNTGPVFLSQDRPAWGNSITQGADGASGIEVPAITIDELCAQYSIEHVDLLKVDIEGAEEPMFAEPHFLPKVGFIVIELHGDYTMDRFSADVAPAGFVVKPPSPHGVRAYVAFPQGRAQK